MLNSNTAAALLKNITYRRRHSSLGANLLLGSIASLFTLCLLIPLILLLRSAFFDVDAQFIGWANFSSYFANPALMSSIGNSLWIAILAIMITIPIAGLYAFALSNTHMPGKAYFKAIAFLPILAPSILPALALVYLFGQQGIFKQLLGEISIYGPLGILISYCFWLFPAVFILMLGAFRQVDRRLIEAAQTLGKSPMQIHWHVTRPAIQYGFISASLVAFTYVITDFGIPKVIGGSFNMMALDVYKQIIGQQNLNMGAVISILLLCPALLAFVIDRYQASRHHLRQQQIAEPYCFEHRRLDRVLFGFCSLVAGSILLVLVTAILASLIRYWPYDLSLTLNHYRFEYVTGGWHSYWNSLKLAFWTSMLGTVLIFSTVWAIERLNSHPQLKHYVQILTLLPLAIPGLVLGIAYILFFNHPANPLAMLYGSMTLLIISTLIHYYTVPHLSLTQSMQQIPQQLDQAAQTLTASRFKLLSKVYLPIMLPTLGDVWVYLFVNAMTTVSAAIFLYSPETSLAAVDILNMDDAGDTVSAVALSVVILLTSCLVKLLHWAMSQKYFKHSQRWRERS
ncbi:putative 2-aminoethylphosphonate ABC transporter permease subunit [Acinetobacter sp. B51(2017)]|uniref:putative 2-aminoethylphosphonate ABC transporter permease subunit n=1 Tax=Acinetobacter sp. B51(2017) TaxID=2060938 RepID=UPI000F07FDDB|nr:putative 2-aminoethylphosphonate ABC transporter permease subunit [Acinetobacter sp. B51(2017)]